jgi:hypothetical protein
MKIKTSEATPRQLNWLAAKCEGHVDDETIIRRLDPDDEGWCIAYSTDWSQGGPIIERECIALRGPSIRGGLWASFVDLSGISQGPQHRHTGPKPLIAAMRCYVASKLGDEVEIPEELK